MKRYLSAAICIMTACAVLSGCDLHPDKISEVELPAAPTFDSAVEESAAPTAGTETVSTETGAPESGTYNDTPVTVNTKNQREYYYDPAEGTQLILTFAYDSPRVTVDGDESSSAAINEYIAMLEDTWYTGNDYGAGTAYGRDMMLEIATDQFTYVYESGDTAARMDMSASRTLTTKRMDGTVISLLYSDYIFAGEGHEENTALAVNFDAQTGERLKFSDLALGEGSAAALAEMIANGQSTVASDVLQPALEAALTNQQWYFTNEGLVVFLQPADAQNAGVMTEWTAAYDRLGNILQSAWLLGGKDAAGSVSIISMEDYAENSAEILDRVVAEDGGAEYLLQVNGTVYDLKLDGMEYSNGSFYKTGEIWCRSIITDASVQISAVIPEGMPDLMLSYRTGAEEHSCYISESGMDGRPILADDSIQAVG